MRLVILDAGPLGLVANPKGRPRAVQCRRWARDLLAAGVRVVVPEVADYVALTPVGCYPRHLPRPKRWGRIET